MIIIDHWLIWTIVTILVLNTVSALITVFHRPRNIVTTWAWILVLLLLPVVGFLIYAFFGRGIAQEKIFSIGNQEHVGLKQLNKIAADDRNNDRKSSRSDETYYARHVISFFNRTEETPLTRHNEIELFYDGKKKFERLFEDMKKAKETIHVEYYAFIKSEIGQEFLDILTEKAKQGLEVRLLYDPWGSGGQNKKWLKQLSDAGGQVLPFITSKNVIYKTRLNYHLHRKLTIIDGTAGWIGGFNVGDQYVGESKKFGYWRDSHIRVKGTATLLMQERFFQDWNASIDRKTKPLVFENKYFPADRFNENTNLPIQIVTDGPDSRQEILKDGFIDMIINAKKSIWIQTPYLIPDDPMFTALTIASRSGVDVRIMVPCMPDHPFIFRATQYYSNLLTQFGIKIYTYDKGFLHAKTSIIDDKICSVGSMNHDFRSYSLNFEANAFIYDSKIARKVRRSFEHDMEDSTLLTQDIIDHQGVWMHFKQRFSRLLSPIL
ncbi:cardiolipin synthase [Companilactobacillus ginsenosidimutans]|uniref:Cardiolipin synthase n=1 Tax=Companilactobacillus ginsenosidimutans TaxID=1007676 RepID=A0A0H4R2N0_9LACO|nr:cardiolipin synthase [Companilactobacillus ginsenosidimutans]AKP68000.1 cardiolipin synthase [Companilactobacillus ginsenosidimutans]